jgi:phospholipid/cholesterol/gamma-HCH transport system substrate-binding protein
MERRAQYLLVAGFLILTIAGMAWFIRWISPTERGMSEERLIQFDSSVSGLSVGSEVRYLGVPVGQVLDIGLNSERYGRVDVVIGVDEPLPPSGKLIALLQAQGITGLALIELRDRNNSYPESDLATDVIPGQPSILSQVSDSAVNVAKSTEQTLLRLNDLLTPQTIEDFRATLSQLRTASGNLANASKDMDQLVSSLAGASKAIENTLPAYRSLAQRLENDVIPTVVDTGHSLQTTANALAQVLGKNQEGVQELLRQDLPTLIGLADDLAITLRELNHLMGNINHQPGAILYGTPVSEVEIPLD